MTFAFMVNVILLLVFGSVAAIRFNSGQKKAAAIFAILSIFSAAVIGLNITVIQ